MPAALNRTLYVTGAAIVFAVLAAVGFLELFANFRAYDDEGFMMLSNRLFLDGHIPFTEITWLYGPVQLAWVQLVHGVLNVPITHSAVRFVTLLVWLSLAGVSGCLVARLGGSRVWALAASVLAFLYTGSIVNEPGHPQGLIALAALLIPLVACESAGASSWRCWLSIGVIAGLIFHIKPNAGTFIIAAVLLVVLSQQGPFRHRGILKSALLIGASSFPFMLMYPLIADRNCLAFALISCFSIAALAVTALSLRLTALNRISVPVAFFAGLTTVTIVALAYALFLGITPSDIVVRLAEYASDQAGFYHYFREYSLLQVGLALTSCIAAARLAPGWARGGSEVPLNVGRALFVSATAYALAIDDPAHAHALLGWAGPWCWLVAFGGRTSGRSSGRLLLASVAAWSPLLAYPVPGSQLYFGSLPLLLAAIVCAADLCDWLSGQGSEILQGRRLRVARQLPPFVALLTVVYLGHHFSSALQRYRNQEPLMLPGAEYLRIEPQRAQHYRALVEAAAQADVLLTTFRFSSLHLWSGVSAPAHADLSNFPIRYASDAVQEQARIGLEMARSPVVVDRQDLRRSAHPSAIGAWIEANFEPYRRIGPYVLLRPRIETFPVDP